jgi:hypothetical protein
MALFHQRVDATAFHAGSIAATAGPRERHKGTATRDTCWLLRATSWAMRRFCGGASMGGAAGTQIVQKNLDRMTIASAVTFVISTLILIFIYK